MSKNLCSRGRDRPFEYSYTQSRSYFIDWAQWCGEVDDTSDDRKTFGFGRRSDQGCQYGCFHDQVKDLAKIVTVLRQENHFVTRLTVRQLAGFGRFPYSKGRLTDEDEAIISKYIDFLDLTDLENRYLDEISGGQRQRAYVAMVLCQETEYVLLDEPLNNLDVARSVRMMEHLRYATNEFGRTILTVMHDINFAAKYSDRICAMKDGQIAAFGTVEEVMDPEILTDIFETKIEIIDGPYGPIAIY